MSYTSVSMTRHIPRFTCIDCRYKSMKTNSMCEQVDDGWRRLLYPLALSLSLSLESPAMIAACISPVGQCNCVLWLLIVQLAETEWSPPRSWCDSVRWISSLFLMRIVTFRRYWSEHYNTSTYTERTRCTSGDACALISCNYSAIIFPAFCSSVGKCNILTVGSCSISHNLL